MGRGGPPEPTLAMAGSVDLDQLVRLVAEGQHAASDYLEDAITTGVTTVGARRAGGGLAGAPYVSNVREAAELAASLHPGLVILEGSGAAIPPVPWDAAILVVPASDPRNISAATSARTGSCGPIWWLLPWQATHPGPKTFPRSVPLFGATWTMRRSS